MKVFDLHNDVLTEVKNYSKEILNYPKNVKVATAIYKGNMSFNDVITLTENYLKLNSENTMLAFEDISYEGLDLDKLLSYKPIYSSLTHNKENSLACGVDFNKPLKEKGEEVIKKLNEYNIPLDLSHLSIKGCYDAINIANRVLYSHVAFSEIYEHKRNIDSHIISDVISKKGIIGLTFVGYFLTDKSASIYSVIKHIDYFLSKFSEDYLSIGTDFNGTDYLPLKLNNYDDFYLLKTELVKLGYKKTTINKIFYENASKFFKINW